jgi:hypothetical protein
MNDQYSYELTYDLGRKCMHCDLPIADQAHKNTKFCERWEDEDGNIICHKDDYHTARQKPLRDILNNISQFHRNTMRSIAKLFEVKGANVTLDDLVAYNITLNRCLQLEIVQGISTFYFIYYGIRQTGSVSFEIFKHSMSYE